MAMLKVDAGGAAAREEEEAQVRRDRERRWNEKGSSQGQNLALTGLCVPRFFDSGMPSTRWLHSRRVSSRASAGERILYLQPTGPNPFYHRDDARTGSTLSRLPCALQYKPHTLNPHLERYVQALH